MKVGAVMSATAVPQVGHAERSPGISLEHEGHFIRFTAAHFIGRRGKKKEGAGCKVSGAGKRKANGFSFPGT
jgi:hypothetical protein